MNSIRVLLADDHQDSMEIMEYFVQDIRDYEIIGKCENGDELVEAVMRTKPDLVLTDINMPKENGLDAIKECVAFCPNLKFIFITGYEDYAVEAFRLSAVDYIVKPVEQSRLYKALDKAKSIISSERESQGEPQQLNPIKNLSLRDQSGIRYIPFSAIYFIEKIGKKCRVYTKNETFETNETIGRILERLDSTFYQGHRSFIINLTKVSHIAPENETFIVHFHHFNEKASISKLKIQEFREKISVLYG